MKFKFKRVNVPNNDQSGINTYLSNKYFYKANLKEILACYEERRKCETHEAYKTDTNLREVSDDGNKDTSWNLFLNLVIGIKETAYYLAASLIHGYGIVKNEFLMYLTMAIGVKLGDKQTIELVGGENIPNQAQKLADKCIEKIKFHAAEVRNREISWEEIMARGKDFDYLVKKDSGHSYCDSIPNQGTVMKKWSVYVEPIIEPLGQHPQEKCSVSFLRKQESIIKQNKSSF
ncbi:hypothetical protein H6P87_00380 [Rickettsia tillamookensis]|uniref:Uncharacterized protein n=1 Tax=Rickettsia tillamookensis TaxID=2761623 RepID=A0A9E6MH04_9RICK|nr:hypothetical protein [Rickettsia tillamookensis]QQV74838.1 hypothetical protein H6P87_00380 [Rickettsia tillamookensis]